jgi:hypothetical protein
VGQDTDRKEERAKTDVKVNRPIALNPLKSGRNFIYCQVSDSHKFYVLPTQCIYVFCVDLRTNSDYFTVQH